MASQLNITNHPGKPKIDIDNIIRIEKGSHDQFKLVYRDKAKQIKIMTSTECEKNGILAHRIFKDFQQELGFETMNDFHEAYQEFYKPWKYGDVALHLNIWKISQEAYPVSIMTLFSIGNLSGYNVDRFIQKIRIKAGIDDQSKVKSILLFYLRLTVYYINIYTTYYLYTDCLFYVQRY